MNNKKENEQKKDNKSGRYIYDKKLNKVVKISDEIVGLNKSSSDNSTPSCSTGGCCPSCGIN